MLVNTGKDGSDHKRPSSNYRPITCSHNVESHHSHQATASYKPVYDYNSKRNWE